MQRHSEITKQLSSFTGVAGSSIEKKGGNGILEHIYLCQVLDTWHVFLFNPFNNSVSEI